MAPRRLPDIVPRRPVRFFAIPERHGLLFRLHDQDQPMRAQRFLDNDDHKKTKAQLIAELEELRREPRHRDFTGMDGELRPSAAELNAILDVAGDAIISMDEDYRIGMFNEGAARIFGFSPEEVIGQSIDMLLPEELRDIHRLHVEKFAKDNKRARLMGERSEVTGVRKNGERFPAEASIAKIHVEGKIVFTVFLRDISRRKSAEQALRESESLLQLIADSMPANIVYMDTEQKYKFVNRTYTDWMRLSKEEVIGKHLTEIVSPEAYKMIKPHLEQALAGNRVDFEGKITFPDNNNRDFHASYVPTFESDGIVNGFAGLIEDITDRKQAEKKLRDSEEHFHNVISNAPLVIWSLDKEGVFTLSEGKGLRRMGLRPGEMVGQSVFEFYKEFPNIIADHKRAFAGETLTGTAQFGDLHFETYISPVLDARGNVERVIGVAIDISDRVQVEEEFRASQRLLQTVFDAVPHWIYVKDREARYILANRSMSSDIDTDGKEIVGMHTLQLNTGSEENVKDFLISDRQVIESGNRIDIPPYEMILADGRRSVRQAVKVPLRDAEGQIIGLVGVSEDITERKQAEEALRKSEERFRAIFNNSPLVIFLMNRDGRYIMVNRQFENWHRVSSNDMIGETHHKVFPSKFADGHAAQDQKVIDSGRAIVWEVEVDMNDGVKRSVVITKFPLFDAEGKVMEVGTISTDVSKQRITEQQLRESQKMEAIGRLAGGIAHEFNNMLQVVISCARTLSDGSVNSQRDAKLVGMILKTSERSADLTRHLLAFSRKSILRPISLRLNELISNQLQLLRRVIGEHIEIGFQANEGLWAVRVDPGIMEQIILNLCLNARDALPNGGGILIKLENISADEDFRCRHGLEDSGHYVTVVVSDNGIGMSSEVRERIFEPFFSTKEVGKGTGLGLAMVQGAVEQHHGVIEVTSEPNLGTTFSIFLPRAKEGIEKQDKPTTAEVAGGSETILVAEDQEDVLNMISRTLESKGYKVIAARNGEEAWTAFKANVERINLVILDMIMPIKTGRMVFEHIQDYGSAVPVLFHSGYSPDSDQVEFLENNGLRLLQKPYDQEKLFSAVREILDCA